MAGVGGGSLLSPEDWNILGTKVQGIPQLEFVVVLPTGLGFSVAKDKVMGRLGKRRDPPIVLSLIVFLVSVSASVLL